MHINLERDKVHGVLPPSGRKGIKSLKKAAVLLNRGIAGRFHRRKGIREAELPPFSHTASKPKLLSPWIFLLPQHRPGKPASYSCTQAKVWFTLQPPRVCPDRWNLDSFPK